MKKNSLNIIKNSEDLRHFKEILIFDKNVSDVNVLLASVDKHVGLLLADGNNIISQVCDVIISGVQKLHILGHGKPGQVILDGFSLDERAWDTIASIIRINNDDTGDTYYFGLSEPNARNYVREYIFKKNMQINFWSCKTGDGIMGKKYTQKIADMLNANVNASSTPVGHEKLGGNWELNVMSNPKVPFSTEAIQNFEHILNHSTYIGQKGGLIVKGTSTFSAGDSKYHYNLFLSRSDAENVGNTFMLDNGPTPSVLELSLDEYPGITFFYSDAANLEDGVRNPVSDLSELDTNTPVSFDYSPTGEDQSQGLVFLRASDANIGTQQSDAINQSYYNNYYINLNIKVTVYCSY